METLNEAVQAIAFLLLLILLFKDMSGKGELSRIADELDAIRMELRSIANELERREQK